MLFTNFHLNSRQHINYITFVACSGEENKGSVYITKQKGLYMDSWHWWCCDLEWVWLAKFSESEVIKEEKMKE